MRTPQTCSSTSRGPLQEQHTEDEGESVASHKTGHSASSSQFSLQECVNEFRLKKIHHSSQSQNTDDDLINQNKSNKQNERISKPCKDGFCYCFTSDSDDFRIYKSDDKKRSRKSETTTEEQISDNSEAIHRVRRRETFPLNPRKRSNVHTKTNSPQKVTAISKLEDSSRNSKAPLIHIIQEIRNNCVVSEVRVNKQKIPSKSSPAKNQIVTEQKIINVQPEVPIDSRSPAYVDRVSEIDSLTEQFQQSSLNTSSRSSGKNGGRLLQKRLSSTRAEYKPRNLLTPPRKPPRNIPASCSERTSISTASSIREAEKVLDEFLRRKGIPVPRMPSAHRKKRKSYPLSKRVNRGTEQMIAHEKPLPSCPSLSDIGGFGSVRSAKSCGIIQEPAYTWQSPKIREMLNLDVRSKNFQSNNPECGPQVGWTLPPKLDIDTVDGAYHNLVANMESKITPVKTEMLNSKKESQKFILTEQLKNFVSNSPWSSKKTKDKQNLKKSNSFLNSSKKKLLRFVTTKSPSTKSRTIGVQTTAQPATDFQMQHHINMQSPPGSYFSNTPAKTSKSSQTEFDFSRTIHSPKRDKIPPRKLIFPKRNILKETPPPKTHIDRNQNQTYQSYNSDLDKDFTLSKMGQLLSNIRNRLEASDDHAVGTFRDIQRKEEEAAASGAFSYDCVDGYDYQKVYHMSAQADVHNEAEPSYSEIEEDSFVISGSPVCDNTNGIEHFVVDNNPKAIYAKINKTPKKCKPHSSSYNNVMEQNSPPKLRNVSKTDLSVHSEIFLENLTSENNASQNLSYEKAEKIPNVRHQESSSSGPNNPDDSYVSVDSYRESLAKEFDAVSYELFDDSKNPINADNATGNQSTPKKTIHLSKFGLKMMSNAALHQTTSCPATPGWLLHDEQRYSPVDESMSLHEQSTTTNEKATNSSLWKYRTLKDKLRKSFRRSRHFLKNEGKRITNTLNSTKPLNFNQSNEPWDASSLCITNLFSMNDNAPVEDQLTQAVNICRLIPELEISPEMVEAERLLLFSTLKRDGRKPNTSVSSQDDELKGVLTLNSIHLPIKANNEQELFFNYYYIGVFSSGRLVKSTQSADCKNGEAIFRNCNISFDNVNSDSEIRCDIFMLRLRKISTARHPPKQLSLKSGSSDEILSRFRPHASFVMHPRDFVPYQLMDSCPNNDSNSFCLHAANSCKFAIVPLTRSSNLLNEVYVAGEVKLLFRKCTKRGFLNVQDASKNHNWNLRWCELDTLRLNVWKCPNDVSINEPIYAVDLSKCISFPVGSAPREICARSRSFRLELESTETPSICLFSADNQSDLNYWISALNEVLEFIAAWMK